MINATIVLLDELMRKKYYRSFLITSQCIETLTEFV